MKITKVKIDSLIPHPLNPRRHNETQVKEMARSIEMFGQTRPIVIDENSTILAGHCAVLALKQLGKIDCDALIYTNLTEAQKSKLLLADNKIAEIGTTDYELALEVLASLGDDIEVPGYDSAVLAELLSGANEMLDSYADTDVEAGQKGFFDVGKKVDEAGEKKTPRTTEQTPEGIPDKEEVYKIVICPHCGKELRV